jgi:hypothetical protein
MSLARMVSRDARMAVVLPGGHRAAQSLLRIGWKDDMNPVA